MFSLRVYDIHNNEIYVHYHIENKSVNKTKGRINIKKIL